MDSDIDKVSKPKTSTNKDKTGANGKRIPSAYILNRRGIKPSTRDHISIETSKKYRTDQAPIIRPVSVNRRFIDTFDDGQKSKRHPREKKIPTAEQSTLEEEQKKD